MKLHGIDLADIKSQTRQFYKLLTYAVPESYKALNLNQSAVRHLASGLRREFVDAFGNTSATNDAAAARFNQSHVTSFTTMLEPILCHLAIDDPKAAKLHMAVDCWGGFDMEGILNDKARNIWRRGWGEFEKVHGVNLAAMERPRKFTLYKLMDSDVLEHKAPIIAAPERAFFQDFLPDFDIEQLHCPAIYVQTLRGIHRCGLNTRDQVRGVGEFDEAIGTSIGIFATQRGAAELNMTLRPNRIRFSVAQTAMRIATLQ